MKRKFIVNFLHSKCGCLMSKFYTLCLLNAWIDLVDAWTDVRSWYKVLFNISPFPISDFEIEVKEVDIYV